MEMNQEGNVLVATVFLGVGKDLEFRSTEVLERVWDCASDVAII